MKILPSLGLVRLASILALALAAAVVSPSSQAVEVLGQQNRIFGEWAEAASVGWGVGIAKTSGVFDTSISETALELNVATEPYALGTASASVGSLALTMTAEAAGGGIPLAEGVRSELNRITMFAQTATRFRPFGPQLSFKVSAEASYNYYQEEQDVRVALKDLTTGEMLLDVTIRPERTSVFGQDYSISVDPTREYELVLVGRVLSFDSKWVDMSAFITLYEDRYAGTGIASARQRDFSEGALIDVSGFEARR